MEQLAILGFESIRVVARRVRTVEVNIHPPEINDDNCDEMNIFEVLEILRMID